MTPRPPTRDGSTNLHNYALACIAMTGSARADVRHQHETPHRSRGEVAA